MKEVWVWRHGEQEKNHPTVWKRNAFLGDEGRRVIQAVARLHLAGVEFAFYGASPFPRALQTIAMALPSGKELRMIEELATVSEEAWEQAFRDHPGYARLQYELEAMYAEQPYLMTAEGERTFQAIYKVAKEQLRDDERALLVSHYPLIECALGFATHTWPPRIKPLGRGEILIFFFDAENNFKRWKDLRIPPPEGA